MTQGRGGPTKARSRSEPSEQGQGVEPPSLSQVSPASAVAFDVRGYPRKLPVGEVRIDGYEVMPSPVRETPGRDRRPVEPGGKLLGARCRGTPDALAAGIALRNLVLGCGCAVSGQSALTESSSDYPHPHQAKRIRSAPCAESRRPAAPRNLWCPSPLGGRNRPPRPL